MPVIRDWDHLSRELESGLRDVLDELIDDTVVELDGPIRQVTSAMLLAAKRGRQDLLEESRDQLALLVLEKELRLRVEGAGLFERLLSMGINALINGAVGGLGSLRTS